MSILTDRTFDQLILQVKATMSRDFAFTTTFYLLHKENNYANREARFNLVSSLTPKHCFDFKKTFTHDLLLSKAPNQARKFYDLYNANPVEISFPSEVEFILDEEEITALVESASTHPDILFLIETDECKTFFSTKGHDDCHSKLEFILSLFNKIDLQQYKNNRLFTNAETFLLFIKIALLCLPQLRSQALEAPGKYFGTDKVKEINELLLSKHCKGKFELCLSDRLFLLISLCEGFLWDTEPYSSTDANNKGFVLRTIGDFYTGNLHDTMKDNDEWNKKNPDGFDQSKTLEYYFYSLKQFPQPYKFKNQIQTSFNKQHDDDSNVWLALIEYFGRVRFNPNLKLSGLISRQEDEIQNDKIEISDEIISDAQQIVSKNIRSDEGHKEIPEGHIDPGGNSGEIKKESVIQAKNPDKIPNV